MGLGTAGNAIDPASGGRLEKRSRLEPAHSLTIYDKELGFRLPSFMSMEAQFN